MVGQTMECFFTPQDRDNGRIQTEMRCALLEGRAGDERWHLKKDGTRFWASGTMMPLRGENDEHLGFVKVLRDRTQEHQAGVALKSTERRLRQSERQLRTIVDHLPVGISLADAPTGRVVMSNDQMAEFLGQDPSIALAPNGERACVFRGEDGSLIAANDHPLAQVLRGECETAFIDAELERPDGICKWVQILCQAINDAEGKLVAVAVVVSDIDWRKKSEQRRRLLHQELAHRLKNTLAIVSSIITQTLRSAPDIPSARTSLVARVQALSQAHDILLSGQAGPGSVHAILKGALAVHDEGNRIETTGPDIPIGPKAALTLSLILNELATNAGKYGALSVPNGTVSISLSVSRPTPDSMPVLTIEWIERDGPAVSPPTRKGFGTRLVEMGLSGSAGASVELVYAPEGLTCRLVAPLLEIMTEEDNQGGEV